MQDYNSFLEDWKKSLPKLLKDTPDQMRAFQDFMRKVDESKNLDLKTKELIAIAVAVASHCEWCIALHVKKALAAGATKEEILDSTWIAVLMGGGPKLMYAQGVLKALEDFK